VRPPFWSGDDRNGRCGGRRGVKAIHSCLHDGLADVSEQEHERVITACAETRDGVDALGERPEVPESAERAQQPPGGHGSSTGAVDLASGLRAPHDRVDAEGDERQEQDSHRGSSHQLRICRHPHKLWVKET